MLDKYNILKSLILVTITWTLINSTFYSQEQFEYLYFTKFRSTMRFSKENLDRDSLNVKNEQRKYDL